MKLALYSDLHLELMRDRTWEPPPLDVDVVILAGDIASHTHGLDWAASVFPNWPSAPKVVYVAGNHEYYGAHLGLLSELRKEKWASAGVHFLEQNTFELPGLRILGCTLWSAFSLYGENKAAANMAQAKQSINDYWLIQARGGRRLEPRDTLALHRTAVRWLDHELSYDFDGKTVVVTHFAPHPGCIAPKYLGAPLTSYFVTDLAWLMEKHRIDAWCYGHTHTNSDFIAENGCRVISNQLGYVGEAVAEGMRPFQENLVVDFGTPPN